MKTLKEFKAAVNSMANKNQYTAVSVESIWDSWYFKAYIEDVGWTSNYSTPELAFEAIGRMIMGLPEAPPSVNNIIIVDEQPELNFGEPDGNEKFVASPPHVNTNTYPEETKNDNL